MDKVRGLVLETEEGYCLVLGPGNEYVKVKTAYRPKIGDMIEGYRLDINSLARRPVSRVWAYVASILITVMLGGFKVYAISSSPTAYVSLDIPPSIELSLNNKGKIVHAKGFNTAGDTLINQAQPEGQELNKALRQIIPIALENQSNSKTSEDSIVMTYTSASFLSGKQLTEEVTTILQDQNFAGDLLSKPLDRKYRDKASASKLSLGQQVITDMAQSTNVPITADELKSDALTKVLKDHNIKLNILIESYTDDQDKPKLVHINQPKH